MKQQVRAFWDAQPCGTGEPTAAPGSREFFEQLAALRYAREPFIADFAMFPHRKGQRVLEIGCGAGTDSAQFALAGARLTAVDLSYESLRVARQHLTVCGGSAGWVEADAERLPFIDGCFDLVYSWGVIHHTPDVPHAISEIRRMLRPGGELRVMIYHRMSWVTLRAWVRHALLKGKPWRSFRQVLASHVESIGTQAFTRKEAHRLFGGYDNLRLEPVLTPYDTTIMGTKMVWLNSVLPRIAKLVGNRFGWFLLISGTKPAKG